MPANQRFAVDDLNKVSGNKVTKNSTQGIELTSNIILTNASHKQCIIGVIDALLGSGYDLVPKNYLKSFQFYDGLILDVSIMPLVKFPYKITYILVLEPSFEELLPRINESSVANFHVSIYLLGYNVLTALLPLYNAVKQNIPDNNTGKNHVGYQDFANVINDAFMLENSIMLYIDPLSLSNPLNEMHKLAIVISWSNSRIYVLPIADRKSRQQANYFYKLCVNAVHDLLQDSPFVSELVPSANFIGSIVAIQLFVVGQCSSFKFIVRYVIVVHMSGRCSMSSTTQ
ncbi:MAG: hypothetical protein EZS28_001736 [Streblomastix strix]|uniref:Uncharacterized protein n=1 Tax=Streblomastix strix TaxID=222440 RepID=A0A5J4X818_9EUKA|nr:MAG: hypothetical protein EZS28_001736 [Streblomastix strix]